ncbi:MAG: sensor domain-containing diguanylate cyclase [Gemmatimonadota bacterium]|nr:sensor domain-containing diguanylate cyclase [Gemmatimonadota bacterium]
MRIEGVAAALVLAVASGGVGAYLAVLTRRVDVRSLLDRLVGAAPRASQPATPIVPTWAAITLGASPLRRDVQASVERAQTEVDLGLLTRYLIDIRDLTGAREAVFWRWSESRGALVPWAWSTEGGDRPVHFRMEEWGPRVRSAAEERKAFFLGGRRPFFAATPVVARERLHGVLTVAATTGLAIDAVAAEEWLPRHATHVAMLLDLFEMRGEYGRSMRQGQALLRAAEQIHSHRSRSALSAAICEMALEVTSAKASALVRCGPGQGAGIVQHATERLGVSTGFELGEGSLVSAAAQGGLPLVMENATEVRRGQLFGPGERFAGAGSIAVVPIGRDDTLIGCLVIAGAEEASITDEEARNVGLLGAIAATGLEIVWEIEEVNRRAETDPLTGLANRRRFDESLQRELSHSDRFGHPVSLVLVDIDHFKAVNDSHGHEAGDAVLRTISRMLADGVRAVDLCARFGGEELAILLPQTTAAGAFELADRLRRRIAGRPIRYNDAEIAVTASFGVASYPDVVRNRGGLFQAADAALYRAKHAGRNRVKLADTSITAPIT